MTPSSSAPLIAVFVAGTNDPSNSETLADAYIEGMKQGGDVRVEKILIRSLDLHHFDLDCYTKPDHESEEGYRRMRALIEEASGLVFASPVWNFSVPAHFKNMIDRMGTFALDTETHSRGQLKGKPCALLYTGGAPLIAWQALMYLTTLHVAEALKYYGGSIADRYFEPRCTPGKGIFGLVVDKRPDTLALMQKKGRSFAATALHYSKHGTLPGGTAIWHKWFEFLYRVGNRIMYPLSNKQ